MAHKNTDERLEVSMKTRGDKREEIFPGGEIKKIEEIYGIEDDAHFISNLFKKLH